MRGKKHFEMSKGSVPKDGRQHSINIASGTRFEDGSSPVLRSPLSTNLGSTDTPKKFTIPEDEGDLLLVLEPIGDDLLWSTSPAFDVNVPNGGAGIVQDGKAKGVPISNERPIFVRADDGTVTRLFFYFETTADDGVDR